MILAGFIRRGGERKFLVHRELPNAGLGNRLSALTSVFLLAILTERALLVDWKRTLPHLHPDKEEVNPPLPTLK
eukprot:786395-Prorocentrum_minimum.AAC.1